MSSFELNIENNLKYKRPSSNEIKEEPNELLLNIVEYIRDRIIISNGGIINSKFTKGTIGFQ